MQHELVITGGSANEDLAITLADKDARFLVFGSTAVHYYDPIGEFAGDLDILVEPTPENSAKVVAVLNAISCHNFAADLLAKPGAQLRLKGPTEALYVDILTARGDFDFETHWAQ